MLYFSDSYFIVTMPPKTKASIEKFLIGQPDSVLQEDFILAVQEGKDDEDIHPWTGPLQLPKTGQVLKLHLFYKDQVGVNNSFVSLSDILNKVAHHVVKNWYKAGFQTVKICNVVKNVKKVVTQYQDMNKNKS